MVTLDEAQAQGIVLGLNEVTGEVRDRLDIDELLLRHPKTFNLYLLALADLQNEATSNKDKMGWFQIAGIHGLPKKEWDGVAGYFQDEKGGYCPHGTILFPTWHRPYLAMMEQTIYHKMLAIAQTFKEPDTYVQAVRDFRLPFWDYLRPRGGNTRFPGVKDVKYGTTGYGWDFSIPYVLEVEKVMVYMPFDISKPERSEDELQEMDNPLFKFSFPKSDGINDTEWKDLDFPASRSSTVRRARQKSDHRQLNTILAQRRESEVESLLNLLYLPYYKDYAIFSNKAVRYDEKKGKWVPTVFGSVESLHDDYHGHCGGIGHMGRVPVAAFDPVFWLHHCNVDRIVAIWQAINQNSWFPEQQIADDPTAETPLLPFRSTKTVNKLGFWSSQEARKVENFGYTYAEIKASTGGKELQARVAAKYAWSSQAYNKRVQNPIIPPEAKPLDLTECPVFKYNTGTLDARLSREIELVSKNEISKTVLIPTVQNQHMLLALPKVAESQTTVNIAALEAPTVTNSPVVVKEPSLDNENQTQGRPNKTDKELTSGKPEGTTVLRQWYIDTVVEKAALDGAFTIFYFVGNFPEDPEQYATAPTIAGSNHVFTAPAAACDNCGHQARQGLLVSDTTPITPILIDYVSNGKLNSLEPVDVTPFLRTNLHWRAVEINEEQPTLSVDVAGLEVAVSSSVAYLHPNDSVPEFIAVHTYTEVTAGRPGGVAS